MNKSFVLLFALFFVILALFGWRAINQGVTSAGDGPGCTVQVYFFKGDQLKSVARVMPDEGSRLKFALEQLFLGPNSKEKEDGFFTQIPADLNYQDIRLSPSLAVIVFDETFRMVSGGTAMINGMLAQIVYTATQFDTISYLNFELENKQYPIIIGGEGIIIDQPLSRQDFKEFE